ncbi:zinc finger protein 22-like [Diaphorina citri]|uniref:Zinc finger protein 22-like n=1 Tax=Diaphorina citri TaxID=121845 RepID=A0A3Q0J8Q7_DIACI|nr:zinc finger protein 22-like [Diaphorina citri]
MQFHIRKHTGEKPYKCDQCSYKCKQSCDLRRHIRIRHSLTEGVERKHCMALHIRKHTGEKPYTCNYCDRKFKQSSHLYTHVKVRHS